MIPKWKQKVLHKEALYNSSLYTVESLYRVLHALGHTVPKDVLYLALKVTGFIKLILIRNRLIETKKSLPKQPPFDRLRQLVKWPLLVSREENLPGFVHLDEQDSVSYESIVNEDLYHNLVLYKRALTKAVSLPKGQLPAWEDYYTTIVNGYVTIVPRL